jgi:hypothetical protein
MDGSQLPPAPQSIKTRSSLERSNKKQLTDNRTSESSRRDDCLSDTSFGYLRVSAGRSTYPSESDQMFHGPEVQPKVLALCDKNSTDNLPSV